MEGNIFVGFTTVESPEIQEQAEASFVRGVLEHEKRDFLIEIIGRIYKSLIARKLMDEHNKKIDADPCK